MSDDELLSIVNGVDEQKLLSRALLGGRGSKRRWRPGAGTNNSNFNSMAGRTWPRRRRRGGAPGGAAPLRHWGARAVATARGGPRLGPQGARRGARRLPALHIPRPRGRGKRGKGDARRPKTRVPGRHSVGCLTSSFEMGSFGRNGGPLAQCVARMERSAMRAPLPATSPGKEVSGYGALARLACGARTAGAVSRA